jgi:5'-deoxynucleotidase YfbR-like HD superfamily hydrolase
VLSAYRLFNCIINALWRRFETSKDHIAILARELDKYQSILKAFEYERVYSVPGLGEEFVRFSPPFTNPYFISKIAEL